MRSFDKTILFGDFGDLLLDVLLLLVDDADDSLDLLVDGGDLREDRSTKAGLRTKMRAKAMRILATICTSHSKMSPRKGMTVHEAAICSIQKAIHFEECSLLKTVPTKGSAKQARKTRGDNSMMRNITNII